MSNDTLSSLKISNKEIRTMSYYVKTNQLTFKVELFLYDVNDPPNKHLLFQNPMLTLNKQISAGLVIYCNYGQNQHVIQHIISHIIDCCSQEIRQNWSCAENFDKSFCVIFDQVPKFYF